MIFNREFFSSPTGQVLLVAAVLTLGALVVHSQHRTQTAAPLPAARTVPSVPLPKILTREGARLPPPPTPATGASAAPPTTTTATPPPSRILPLALAAMLADAAPTPSRWTAPAGRMIPCMTVTALESNRLETPIVGLVTEDVWQDGAVIVPAGAEIHGRAALDHARERIAGQRAWRIVWRTNDADNGLELPVDGILLEREYDAEHGTWGPHDGSAGLRGQIVRQENDRQLRLFAATFLASATAALQETHATVGLLGESTLPAATARNATLAGTSAVIREHVQALREAIARDGFYVRIPAGHSFYLYTTQAIDRSMAPRARSVL